MVVFCTVIIIDYSVHGECEESRDSVGVGWEKGKEKKGRAERRKEKQIDK
jgi:hypothetical protein